MSHDKKRVKILVVDDDEGIRQSLALLLKDEGYEVCTASDGFDALLQMKHLSPDVITSDLNMPHMSGFEFLSVVRRRFPHILVIAISGAFDSAASVPGGVIADAFYAKGQHEPQVLLDTIANLIRASAERSVAHESESAPVWIPRNGKDSRGIPYIVLTCTECLRSFPLSVPNEAVRSHEIEETPCIFCLNPVRYVVDFSNSIASPRRAHMSDIFSEPHNRVAGGR